jgi:HK97 family phage prohead protease
VEQKAFQLSEVKTGRSKGEFTALVSVFGNVDHVGDRVHPGAFTKAIAEQEPPPIYFAHNWMQGQPPIGQSLDWSEQKSGLEVKGKLFVDDDDRHAMADMVYAGMKHREGVPPALSQFSFAYDVDEAEFTAERSGRVRELKSIFPVHEVGPCPKGANDASSLIEAPKSLQQFFINAEPELKAVWSTKYINDLPDSAFLYIEDGGDKDPEGKTTPRSLRHFPYKDASGSVDLPHLRNALSRIPQSSLPAEVKDRVSVKAQRILDGQKDSVFPGETKDSTELVIGMLAHANTFLKSVSDEQAQREMKAVANDLLSLLERDFVNDVESFGLEPWRFPPLHGVTSNGGQ